MNSVLLLEAKLHNSRACILPLSRHTWAFSFNYPRGFIMKKNVIIHQKLELRTDLFGCLSTKHRIHGARAFVWALICAIALWAGGLMGVGEGWCYVKLFSLWWSGCSCSMRTPRLVFLLLLRKTLNPFRVGDSHRYMVPSHPPSIDRILLSLVIKSHRGWGEGVWVI